jgi:hypothetical protein
VTAEANGFLPGAPSGLERRDALRIDILGSLRADVLIPQRVEITDISAAGLQVASPFPFQLDAIHEFRLTLDQSTVIVKGRVVHSAVTGVDPDGVQYRTGIDLVEVPEAVHRALERFARRLVEARQGA